MKIVHMKKNGAMFEGECPFVRCKGDLIINPFHMRYRCSSCGRSGKLLGPKMTDENLANKECRWTLFEDWKPQKEVLMKKQAKIYRSGSIHKGLCPFHEDANPSLIIKSDLSFHCVQCGASGVARLPAKLELTLEKTGKVYPKKKAEKKVEN
jgi:hypothetical protein